MALGSGDAREEGGQKQVKLGRRQQPSTHVGHSLGTKGLSVGV